MAEPRILILGAGVYQAPLIRRAREMGHETVVLSTPGPWPGVALADTFLPVDITDPEAVVAAAREQEIGGVVTAGTDHGLPALGTVVDVLGLPGPGARAAADSRDKIADEGGLRTNGGALRPGWFPWRARRGPCGGA